MLAIRPFFFADYRDLRDALVSAKLRVRTDFLRGFLAERGIILSASSTREELIDAVAAYAYQASDLDVICDQLEIPGRKDKLTYTVLPGVVTADIVHEALANLKRSRHVANERIDGDRGSGDGPISINVDYYEMHAERTMLRQMQPKHGTVQVMKVGDETRIRFPSTEHITEVVADLIGEINKLIPASDQLRPQVVSLAGFTKLQRTEFFQKLISNIEGYKRDDVTKVNLNNELEIVPMAGDVTPSGVETEGEDGEDEDDSPSSSATKSELESEMKALLKRASLDGSGILHAPELKRFLESGFYISRISWSVKPRSKRDAKPRVEFEARLADPASGSGFEYGIRKVYRAKRDKTYNKIGVAPSELETAGLLDALEKAVQLSFEQVSEVPE